MKIAVFGSINMDVILRVGDMPAGGQNIYAQSRQLVPGGKGANAATALAKLGESVSLFACVGDDADGRALTQNVAAGGVDTAYMPVKPGENTGAAYILVEDSGENRIIVDPGANEAMTGEDILGAGLELIRQSDLVLLDLEISIPSIEKVVELCWQEGKRLVVDAGPIRGVTAQQLAGAFCISPNESELQALVGRPVESDAEIERAAQDLLDRGTEQVLVKLGGRGCYFASREERFFFPAYRVKVVDTTAAGDSFTAGYCSGVLAGMDHRGAVEMASKCGAIAVTRVGATPSTPSREDLARFHEFCPAYAGKGE